MGSANLYLQMATTHYYCYLAAAVNIVELPTNALTLILK